MLLGTCVLGLLSLILRGGMKQITENGNCQSEPGMEETRRGPKRTNEKRRSYKIHGQRGWGDYKDQTYDRNNSFLFPSGPR